jgi:hypothetical protein
MRTTARQREEVNVMYIHKITALPDKVSGYNTYWVFNGDKTLEKHFDTIEALGAWVLAIGHDEAVIVVPDAKWDGDVLVYTHNPFVN